MASAASRDPLTMCRSPRAAIQPSRLIARAIPGARPSAVRRWRVAAARPRSSPAAPEAWCAATPSESANRRSSRRRFSAWPERTSMEMADDRSAREIEIAHRVEHLVAHELVAEAQAAFVEDAVAADHDGVVERSAAAPAPPRAAFHLLEEAEGAGAADFALEARRIGRHRDALAPDRVRGEIDGEAQARIRRPARATPRRPRPSTRTGFRILMRAARRVLLHQPGALDQEDEGRGAAVHRRHFRPVELDQHVVDLEPGEGRHQMLDGRDRRRRHGQAWCTAPTAPGCARSPRSRSPWSLRRKRMPISVAAGCSDHRDRHAGVKADAAAAHLALEGLLAGGAGSLPSASSLLVGKLTSAQA